MGGTGLGIPDGPRTSAGCSLREKFKTRSTNCEPLTLNVSCTSWRRTTPRRVCGRRHQLGCGKIQSRFQPQLPTRMSLCLRCWKTWKPVNLSSWWASPNTHGKTPCLKQPWSRDCSAPQRRFPRSPTSCRRLLFWAKCSLAQPAWGLSFFQELDELLPGRVMTWPLAWRK